MKDKFKKLICGSIVALSLPVLVACGEKPTLAKPTNVSIDETTHLITWQAVDNAEYYIVEINGKTYQSTTASFPASEIISKGGNFYIRVLAMDRDDQFLPSTYSDVASIQNLLALSTPDIEIRNNVLSWTDVGAKYYVVSINGVKFEVSTTSLNLAELDEKFMSAINFGKLNKFNVFAKATSNNLKSDVSQTVEAYIASPQSAPKNLVVQKQADSVMLSFDSVSTATSYTVKVNDTEFVTEQLSVDISAYLTSGFGEYSICVKANQVKQTIDQEDVILYMESAFSDAVVYEQKPSFVTEQVVGLVIEDGVLSFDLVQDATSYLIYVNDNQYQSNTNNFNLASLGLSAGKYNVSVVAKNGNYQSLPSNVTQYKVTAVLNTPGVSVYEQQDAVFVAISPVQNATKYQLQINQMVLYTTDLQVDITNYLVGGINNISAVAVGDNDIYFNSTEVKTTYNLLGVPQNLVCTNGILTFDEVEDCSQYEIFVNDNLCLTTQNTSVDISNFVQATGIYQIKVRATVDNRQGAFANTTYVQKERLAVAQNLVIESTNDIYTLTFSHDGNNVIRYDIYINDNLACQSATTVVDITNYLQTGENIVYVKAIGDGTVYLDSNASQSQSVSITKSLEGVKNMSVYAETGSYFVSFDGVADADSYKLTVTNESGYITLNQTILASDLVNNSIKFDISSAITQKSKYEITVTSQSSVPGYTVYKVKQIHTLSNYAQSNYSSVKYFYNGKDYTYCINSAEELETFVYYAVLYRLDSAEVYINFDYEGKANAFASTTSLLQQYLPSISKYGVDINQGNVLGQLFSQDNLNNLEEILSFIEQVHDQIYLYYDVTSNLTSQKSNCVYTLNFEYVGDYEATKSNGTYVATEPPQTTTRTFAIDNKPTAPVETVAQLLMAVQNGRKPQFITTEKTQELLVGGKSIAERTYLKAREILDQICNDSMTDFEKALAIYNWIVATNEYDYDTCGAAEGAPFSSDNLKEMAFYASGMLLNNLSVCKGISQAFSLMCNIEGIKTIETFGITGAGIDWANVDFKNLNMATYNLLLKINNIGAHSWNRIYLDAGQGAQWYIVDATWENQYSNTEFVSHDYFLINDNQIADNRKEFYPHGQFYFETDSNGQVIDYAANGSYAYYADTNTIAVVLSQTELNNVVQTMISNNANGFEVIFDSSILGQSSSLLSQTFANNSLDFSDYNTVVRNNYVLVYKKS